MKLFYFVGGGTYSTHATEAIRHAHNVNKVVILVANDLEITVQPNSTVDEIVDIWAYRARQSKELDRLVMISASTDDLDAIVDVALQMAQTNSVSVMVKRGRKQSTVYPWSSREYVLFCLV